MGPETDIAALEARLREGFALHQDGRLDAAEAAYRVVLAQLPDHFDALHLLGVVATHRGNPAEAVTLIRRALAIVPTNASAHYNLGNALDELLDHEAAIGSYRKAIEIQPDYFLAHFSSGAAHTARHDYEAAVACFDQAIAINPDVAEAHYNRAMAVVPQRGIAAALESLNRAIALKTDFADAYHARALAHRDAKRFTEALADCDRAIVLKPDFVAAQNARGAILTDLGQYQSALESFDTVLALNPDDADACNNRGLALFCSHRAAEAIVAFDKAIALKDDDAAFYHNRGMALDSLHDYAPAIENYEKALALRPGYEFLPGTLRYTKMRICDWTQAERDFTAIADGIGRGEKVAPGLVALAITDSPALQRQAAETAISALYPANPALGPITHRAGTGKIRLGYFSMDFRDHPVAVLTAGLFEAHDREKFEITAFSYGPDTGDAMRGRLEKAFDRFIDVRNKSDIEIAALARSLDIDIAIDLAGLTTLARPGIFALRAAPVQVSYIGYPGTMGAPYIDYIVADATVIPEDHARFYVEKIARLPCFQANDTKRDIADKDFSRAELGLPPRGFVFCCFNNLFKVLPATFDGWMRILRRVPESVLMLASDNDAATRNLRAAAAARGIDPARLVFGQRLSPPQYLARYRAVDLFLDTLPYNAGTTASDALWAGVPVLTLAGGSFAGRMAASLLKTVDLAHLITTSQRSYEDTAVVLALDGAKLDGIKRKLARERLTGPLFKIDMFARHIETAYTRMVERHRAGLPPDHINVAPGKSPI